MTQLLIKNGRIIDPATKTDKVGDLLIEDGHIKEIGKVSSAKTAQVIDATDKLVTPGLIDMHVHLREPGDEEEETIASGSAAAVAGGFTSIVCMPNTDPPIDNEATVDFVYRQAAAADMAHVYAAGALTKQQGGKELAEMGQMVRGGAIAFTDDGQGVQNPAVMLKALQYASMFDKVVMQHCQDNQLSNNGAMNAGYNAAILGLPGISPLAEELMLYRDIQLVRQSKARYHAQHISTAGSVEIIRTAKQKGIRVTAEVTPHHLLLTEEACCDYDTNTKMNPPLRTEKDLAALREAVADGTIDCLATDHAPHLSSEKELEFIAAPCGIISLDCALGLYAKALIDTGTIDWARLIEMMTVNPAGILGIERGTLAVGAPADVTIIDHKNKFTVKVENFASKSRNCPYNGWCLSARAVCTIVDGKVKFQAKA